MFTGIVEGRGSVDELTRTAKGARIVVSTALDLSDCRVGDSIAVDGCCLTATSVSSRGFGAEASNETLKRTTLGDRRTGHQVNLERALRVGDRLGGHIVQGHVDATGRLSKIVKAGDAADYHFDCPAELDDYLVEKGSITVDGISLTVNGVRPGGFHVTIIGHTAAITTLGAKAAGARVNLETDVVGKYIVSLARRGRIAAGTTGVTLEKLEEHGFA